MIVLLVANNLLLSDNNWGEKRKKKNLPVEKSCTGYSSPALRCYVEDGPEWGDGSGHGQCHSDGGIDVRAWKEGEQKRK